MDSADQLLRLFAYDTWSNEQVLLTLQDHLNNENLNEAVELFAHIAGAQEHWFCRIKGKPQDDIAIWPDYDLAVALQKLKTLREQWQNLIENNRDSLDRLISYTNSSGTPYETPLSDILHHIIIHGQHHRAQIAKLLRNAKITPPATDFIYFSRAN